MMMEEVVLGLSVENFPPMASQSPDDVNITSSQVLPSAALPWAPSPDIRYNTTDHSVRDVNHSPQQVAAALALTVGMWEVGIRVIIKFHLILTISRQ